MADANATLIEGQLKVGWTSSPNTRGTLDILTTWAFTIIVCSWNVLCINVPTPGSRPSALFWLKAYLVPLIWLGPEFILIMAIGQLLSARQSVADFHSSGYTEWTIRLAFFADMGGFVLKTPDWVPFPIDAKQLHYLVTKEYVAYPDATEDTIRDRNKVDGSLRIITFCQITWFLIVTIARAVQHLEITGGDLTVVAYIIVTLITAFCWRHKPADVLTAITIESKESLREILLQAGDCAQERYQDTPLDFVSRREWPWSLYFQNWTNILRNMGINFRPHVRPVTRFRNTAFPVVEGKALLVSMGVALVHSAIFLCGWNFSFPTRTEQILWRAASTTVLASVPLYWIITEFSFVFYPSIRRRLTSDLEKHSSLRSGSRHAANGITRGIKSFFASCRNNSISKDPQLDVPLKAILPIYILGVFYCHARVFIFVEDILQLRSLPPSAYQTVSWQSFIPHF
jgi:hypothetical protein